MALWNRLEEHTGARKRSFLERWPEWAGQSGGATFLVRPFWILPHVKIQRWTILKLIFVNYFLKSIFKIRLLWGFRQGPVVRTLYFHCRRHGFDPWSGKPDPTSLLAWLKKKNKTRLLAETKLQMCFWFCVSSSGNGDQGTSEATPRVLGSEVGPPRTWMGQA